MFKRIVPLLAAVCLLVFSLSVSASAVILDPYENGSVSVDGNLEVVSVRLDTSNMFWQRFHNGSASYNGIGSNLTYSTEMRYVDNDTVSCWPFGLTTYVLTGGIPTGSNISVDMAIGVNIENQSQTFECVGYLYLDTYDSLGRSIARTTVWTETQSNVDGSLVFFVDPDIDTAALQGSYQWSLTFSFDFNGVSDESDTTNVTLQCFGENISLQIPYSQLYQLQQQGAKTNKLLDQIDKQMTANGEKLDDVIAQGQANGEKLDGIQDSLDDTHQMWEDTINGTVPPHDPEGSDVVDDFHDSENELWGSVSGGLDELDDATVSAGGSIASLAVSFFFVTSFLNVVWGLPPIESILQISLSLGAVASILGLGSGFYRRSSRHGGKS